MNAASALKMSYAGITKGTQALGAAMMLAATRGGTADALFAELQGSQPQMLAWLKRGLELMPPKAYRWIAEMHEIADFVGEDTSAHEPNLHRPKIVRTRDLDIRDGAGPRREGGRRWISKLCTVNRKLAGSQLIALAAVTPGRPASPASLVPLSFVSR